jgi:hypothetical protein
VIDYYSLLRNAVCALERNTQDERNALYERVRNALGGMLRAADPSPTESEIVDECLALDTAISRLEAPYSFLDTLSHLPPNARAALRSTLDTMRRTDIPLPPSKVAARLQQRRSTTPAFQINTAPEKPQATHRARALARRNGGATLRNRAE